MEKCKRCGLDAVEVTKTNYYCNQCKPENHIVKTNKIQEKYSTNRKEDVEIDYESLISNIILLPFRMVWNIIVALLIIGGFILWWGFIFGSVLGVILILIFAPDLFLLPLFLVVMFTHMWDYKHNR